MSAAVRELLQFSPLLYLPLVALFLFLGVFVAIIVRTYGSRAEAYAKQAGLPLANDVPPQGGDHV